MTMSRRRFLAGLGLGGGGLGVVAALRSLGGHGPRPAVAAGTSRDVEPYGDGPLQRGEWWVPPAASALLSATGRLPTVVLVHGGYWGPGYDRHLEDALAADLAGRGYLCWNLDYAAADMPWPSTLRDVAAGYDHLLAGRHADRVDPRRVAVVGHSAGGHLALWLASRQGAFARPAGVSAPALAVGQAPVAALADAFRENLGGGAVGRLLGGSPTQVPDRYRAADPVALLPSHAHTVLIHGRTDQIVPTSQSETYQAAATAAGDDCRLERVAGGHFEHLDPRSAAVAQLRVTLAGFLGVPGPPPSANVVESPAP